MANDILKEIKSILEKRTNEDLDLIEMSNEIISDTTAQIKKSLDKNQQTYKSIDNNITSMYAAEKKNDLDKKTQGTDDEEASIANIDPKPFGKVLNQSNIGFAKLLKEKVMNPKDWFQPKNLIGMGGLLADAPIFMLLGDNIQDMYDGFKDMRKENLSANKKNEQLLKKQVTKDEMKNIQKETSQLGSKDSKEIRKILIQNGIKSEDQIDSFISNIKAEEEKIMKSNADIVDELRLMNKSDDEIANILRTGNGLDQVNADILKKQSDTITDSLEKMLVDVNSNLTSVIEKSGKEQEEVIALLANYAENKDISKLVDLMGDEKKARELAAQLNEQQIEENAAMAAEQLILLQNQLDSLDELQDSIKEEKDNIFDDMFSVVAIAGLALGAIVRKVILPFELLYKTISPIIKLTGILGNAGGAIDSLKSIFTFFSKIPAIGQFMAKFGDLAGKFFKYFKIGFKFLGWPLQIVMSTIDFVKGFMSTEGDIIDKIKGGLLDVVKGFIELPAKLLGWIADWALGLFGVNIDGGAGKAIVDSVMNAFSLLIDGILAPFRLLKGIFDTAISVIKGETSILDAFKNIGQLFMDYFKGIAGAALSVIPGGSWIAKKLGLGKETKGDNKSPEDIVKQSTPELAKPNIEQSQLELTKPEDVAMIDTVSQLIKARSAKSTQVSNLENAGVESNKPQVAQSEQTTNNVVSSKTVNNISNEDMTTKNNDYMYQRMILQGA